MDAALLQCIICPGQPRFSDVSHLLTHVSSKAHLAHYFTLQVRSHQENEALELLLEYDGWFGTNNLAQLLSERIGSKDDRKKKRKSQGKGKIKSTDADEHPASSRSRGDGPADPSHRPSSFIPDYLDPRLADWSDQVKPDPGTGDASFSSHVTPSASAAARLARAANAEMGMSVSADKTKLGKEPEKRTPDFEEQGAIPFPVTPTPPTRIGNRAVEVSWTVGHEPSDPFVNGNTLNESSDDVDADKERLDEMARLKGVLWPGMDIFDSATLQMRRRRNQKKDGTVLKMMELTSSLVEPTELIFSPSGVLRKQRVISGNVEDDSPLKGESPIPKRRPPRPKPSRPKRLALTQLDPNVARGQDRKRVKRAAKHDSVDVEENTPQDNAAALPFHNPLPGIRSVFSGHDEEFDLSFQAFGKRPRSGFTIFADEENQDMQSSHIQHAQPVFSRDTLTPARLVLDKSDALTNRGFGTEHFVADKENVEPMLNTQSRLELPSWSNSPFLKRCNNPGYASRYIFDDTPSMGLGPVADRDQGGYRSNPLLAPSSKVDFYEDDPYSRNGTVVSSGWTAVSRAVSSETTVSEEEQHDLARLYLESTAD